MRVTCWRATQEPPSAGAAGLLSPQQGDGVGAREPCREASASTQLLERNFGSPSLQGARATAELLLRSPQAYTQCRGQDHIIHCRKKKAKQTEDLANPPKTSLRRPKSTNSHSRRGCLYYEPHYTAGLPVFRDRSRHGRVLAEPKQLFLQGHSITNYSKHPQRPAAWPAATLPRRASRGAASR